MASGKLLEIALKEYGVTEKHTVAKNTYHYVNHKDTLYSLARFYYTTVDKIKQWNNLTNNTIIVGQSLRVAEPEFKEITESRILQYAKETGISGISSDQDAWCGVFVAWVAMKAGFDYAKSPSARAWLNEGTKTEFLHEADIVVYWRESQDSIYGHVGIPLTYTEDKEYIYTLGGNQSNSVCIKPYPVSRLLGFRKL